METRLTELQNSLEGCDISLKAQQKIIARIELDRASIEQEIALIKLSTWNEAHDSSIQIGDKLTVTQEIHDWFYKRIPHFKKLELSPFKVGAKAVILSIDFDGQLIQLKHLWVCSVPFEFVLRANHTKWGMPHENNL